MIINVACLAVGFIAGALVFRNNPAKSKSVMDALVAKYEEEKAKLKAEIESLKNKK